MGSKFITGVEIYIDSHIYIHTETLSRYMGVSLNSEKTIRLMPFMWELLVGTDKRKREEKRKGVRTDLCDKLNLIALGGNISFPFAFIIFFCFLLRIEAT